MKGFPQCLRVASEQEKLISGPTAGFLLAQGAVAFWSLYTFPSHHSVASGQEPKDFGLILLQKFISLHIDDNYWALSMCQ